MSEPGYIAVHRSIWEHRMFADDVFSEREAWLWMVSSAAWKACKIRSGNAMVDIKRGELLFSTRFLAKRWKWSHTKVVRFLILLENETQIGTDTKHNSTHITICNYDKYQVSRNTSETVPHTLASTDAVQTRYKEEEGNNIIKEISRAPALVFETDWPKDYKELFWQLYPRRTDKAAAFRKLEQLRRGGDLPWARLMAGVERYAQSVSGKDPKFTKGPVAWLNAGKWDDEIGSNSRRVEGWV